MLQGVVLGTIVTAWAGVPWCADIATWVVCFVVEARLTCLETIIVASLLNKKR